MYAELRPDIEYFRNDSMTDQGTGYGFYVFTNSISLFSQKVKLMFYINFEISVFQKKFIEKRRNLLCP